MAIVIESPLQSDFGFQSPSFIVDSDGNITARSITLEEATEETNLPADFSFTEVNNNFRQGSSTVDNPSITVFRDKSILIDVNFVNLGFNIFQDGTTTPFSTGLKHDSGTTGDAAQNKSSGRYTWTVPLSAPDTLIYSDSTGTIFGTIVVQDRIGLFSSVSVTGGTESTSSTTGALVVTGGIGVSQNITVNENIVIGDIKLNSTGLDTQSEISFSINDIILGKLTTNGITVPLVNTTIDNTVIGQNTPSSANFTIANTNSTPSQATNVTNKKYVDETATAFSIIFGL